MENKRYYYKISLFSDRGRKIKNFLEKGKKAAQAAEELSKELGASAYTDRPGCLYPGVGIGSLVFKRWPGGKRYESIGSEEYIPNMNRKEGIEIAKRIKALPDVTPMDFCPAFGIPANQSRTPQWFVLGDTAYLSSSYKLGKEYSIILQNEFDVKRKKA